jgi:hypothetical protein
MVKMNLSCYQPNLVFPNKAGPQGRMLIRLFWKLVSCMSDDILELRRRKSDLYNKVLAVKVPGPRERLPGKKLALHYRSEQEIIGIINICQTRSSKWKGVMLWLPSNDSLIDARLQFGRPFVAKNGCHKLSSQKAY